MLRGLETVTPPLVRSVLTVGNFDGVHRAHQHLLGQARRFSSEKGGPVVALTFEPHPLTVVAPSKVPPRLCSADDKLRYLAQAGADWVVVAKSEPALLTMEAERFIEEVLIARFHPIHIVEGPSFGFGRGRKGNPAVLRRVAVPLGCEVHIVEPVTILGDEGETLMVSSSLIRRLIAETKVEQAALCLGRPYALTGEVVQGDRRGRTIGFPTANLSVSEQLIPGDGVYAGRASAGGPTYSCAISVGHTPTFGGTAQRLEAHLLDFDGELYGRTMRLEFDRLLRHQRKFDSASGLVDQLRRDVEAVRSRANRSDQGTQEPAAPRA